MRPRSRRTWRQRSSSTRPRLELAVSGANKRSVASLEPAAMTRRAISAKARSRSRVALRPNTRGMSSLRIMAIAAATWPCGNERRISTASPDWLTTAPPFRSTRNRRSAPEATGRDWRWSAYGPALAIALAQEHGRRRAAVRDDVDEHRRIESPPTASTQPHSMDTFCTPEIAPTSSRTWTNGQFQVKTSV
jgi:hypothetical protein